MYKRTVKLHILSHFDDDFIITYAKSAAFLTRISINILKEFPGHLLFPDDNYQLLAFRSEKQLTLPIAHFDVNGFISYQQKADDHGIFPFFRSENQLTLPIAHFQQLMTFLLLTLHRKNVQQHISQQRTIIIKMQVIYSFDSGFIYTYYRDGGRS